MLIIFNSLVIEIYVIKFILNATRASNERFNCCYYLALFMDINAADEGFH